MNLKQYLDNQISAALSQLSGLPHAQALVQHAKNPQFGDYQANGIMALAKQLGRNPRELGAEAIARTIIRAKAMVVTLDHSQSKLPSSDILKASQI